jgi:hypothetical protein
MTTAEDPWTGLEPPASADIINAKRVDGKHPWNFFWARSVDRKCLLILQCAAASAPKGKLPKVKGIEVALSEADSAGHTMVSLKLTDNQHRDIFHRLCLDIVQATSLARSEVEAGETFLARTWRWHHLLRGGGDSRLSAEGQKGLIGELLVLERYLIPAFGPADATGAWVGPTGSPKDFECGRIAIEAKARRGAARPYVVISSEFQLDTDGCDALFLYVVELDPAPGDSGAAFTLTDVARRISTVIAAEAPSVVERFEGQLVAAGFSWDDDYSSSRWLSGPHRFLHVTDNFPRITPVAYASGVERVRYDLSLVDCEQFRIDDDIVRARLKGAEQ